MLRKALLMLAALVLLTGLCRVVSGNPDGRPLTIWGGLMVLAVLLERWRYITGQGARGTEWQPTEERFGDPVSGEPLQVFYNPRTGERRYERGDDPAQP